jgi:Capsular polysaccharide biosynthesis protein
MKQLDLPPDQSIRDKVAVLERALFLPNRRRKATWRYWGGVRSADGSEHPYATGWHYPKDRATIIPEDYPLPEEIPSLEGDFLYLGHYPAGFGHFLLESTARLWHLRMQDKAFTGALMLKPRKLDEKIVERQLQEFAELCGLELPPLIWPDGPVRLSRLTVPQQGSGALDLMLGAPEYRDMIVGRFAADVPAQGAKKIYISRSGLDSAHGSLIEEDKLERLLVAEGFEIYHPQDHSFRDQIGQYKAADVIVGVDGSAFHAVSLVSWFSEKTVAIIKRRPAIEAEWQARQLSQYGATRVGVVACDETAWSPAGVRRAALSMFGTLPFAAAGRALHDLGAIAHPEAWQDTPEAERETQIRAIGAQLGCDMCEVRTSGTSLDHLPPRQKPDEIRLIGVAERMALSEAR